MCTVVKTRACVCGERVRTEMKEGKRGRGGGEEKYLLLRFSLRVDAHVDENKQHGKHSIFAVSNQRKREDHILSPDFRGREGLQKDCQRNSQGMMIPTDLGVRSDL